MKFEKFVKTLGGHGIIYRYKDTNWLASFTVLMRIPDDVSGVLSESISEMPEGLKKFIEMEWKNDPCLLTKAELPRGNSGIKEAIRIYETEHSGVVCRIDNDSYSLIDKGDILEIYPEYDSEQSVDVAKALVIRAVTPDPDEEPQIVGFIFPIAE